jgi:hypothetical protein
LWCSLSASPQRDRCGKEPRCPWVVRAPMSALRFNYPNVIGTPLVARAAPCGRQPCRGGVLLEGSRTLHAEERAKRQGKQGGEAMGPVPVWSDEGSGGWSTPARCVSLVSWRWGSREGLLASELAEAADFFPLWRGGGILAPSPTDAGAYGGAAAIIRF